jgi:hypothetical protein
MFRVTKNPRFDIGRSYIEFSPQMHPKAQTVEECAGTENAFMPDEFARQKAWTVGACSCHGRL